MRLALATPTPFTFNFTTVDDPRSATYSPLYGLDDLQQVVGAVGIDNAGNTAGFHSADPYAKFFGHSYPGASSTVLVAENPGGGLYAGYFVKNGTTWGFIRNSGIYYAFQHARTPKGKSVNELLGINNDGIAVGFYADRKGNDHAYEVADHRFINLVPPNAVSARASGVTLARNIAGSETLANGETEGWYRLDGNYTTFRYPGSSDTEVNGLSAGVFDTMVVGSYVDRTGKTHGFILRHPAGGKKQIWQSVDEPNADGTTVLTGMNNHHAMTGWYVDVKGKTNGFVATLNP